MRELIDKLYKSSELSKEEAIVLLGGMTPEDSEYLFEKARSVRERYYGRDIYVRGLIEFTNICKNDCYYCGIRKSNGNVERYRLSREQILDCCRAGYDLGFRTFVLQGGEDGYYTDDRLCEVVSDIKALFPDTAITLSIGERSYDSYKRLYDAGADRYLLRHETAVDEHYGKLHPESLSATVRKQCLNDLKSIGYHVGTGFMVGSPYQTLECLAEDLLYLQQFQPDMVGIGPFIPHHDTPFANFDGGSLDMTLILLAIIRLLLPKVLLPATTALGTIDPRGRELGVLAGANVVMPNLSPLDVRKNYLLYDNKISTGDEAAESRDSLARSMKAIGYDVVISRGDPAK